MPADDRGAAVLLDIGEDERLVEQIEMLQEVQTAEQQLAVGQGVEHSGARARLLERLRKRSSSWNRFPGSE